MSADLKCILSCWMKRSAHGLFGYGLAGWGAGDDKCRMFGTGADFYTLKIGMTREKSSKNRITSPLRLMKMALSIPFSPHEYLIQNKEHNHDI